MGDRSDARRRPRRRVAMGLDRPRRGSLAADVRLRTRGRRPGVAFLSHDRHWALSTGAQCQRLRPPPPGPPYGARCREQLGGRCCRPAWTPGGPGESSATTAAWCVTEREPFRDRKRALLGRRKPRRHRRHRLPDPPRLRRRHAPLKE